MHLRSWDWNLVPLLAELLSTVNVSRAAKRAGLTQPAMSHALNRLRQAFDDPLLVRVGQRMVLTEYALTLKTRLPDLLAQMETFLAHPNWQPGDWQGEFQLGANDYSEWVLVPHLMATLGQGAPQAALVVHVLGTQNEAWYRGLREGELHAAVGFFFNPPEDLHRIKLFSETFCCIVRAQHAVLETGLNLDTYCDLDHVLVAPRAIRRGVVDDLLEQQGRKRRITCALGHFQAAPALVAQSDLICTLPRRMGLMAAQRYGCVILEPPLAIPGFDTSLVWHPRYQHQPEHTWMRSQIQQIAKSL